MSNRNTSKLIEKARDAIKKKSYDYAIELYQQALGIDPDDAEARKELRATQQKRVQVEGGGMAKLKGIGPLFKLNLFKIMKKWDECIRECENFLRYDPRDKGVLHTLGVACIKAGYLNGAILTFEDLVESDKKNMSALKELGYLYVDSGDFGKATQYFERARKLDPNNGEIQKALRDIAAKGAETQMQDGLAKTEGSFRGIIKDTEKAKKLEKQQKRLRTTEDVEQAITFALEEIEEEPIPKNYRKLAELYLRLKDYAKAEAAYDEALKKDARDTASFDGKADLKMLQFDEMINQLNKKLKKEPSNDLKAKLKKVKGQKLEFCIQEWERRVKEQPTNLGLKYEYGSYLLKGGRVDDAITELQRALKDPRKEIDAHIKLGQCFEKKKKFDMAIKEYERALSSFTTIDEDKPKEIVYYLGRAYMEKGDKPKAKKEFEKIYEVDINYKDVADKLEALGGH